MSYVISNELYNQLINANTLEEFQQSRDLIVNSQTSDEISLNYNSIFVRILSLSEYDKYIVNSTLNGSVTKKNINVWHYQGLAGGLHYAYASQNHWNDCNASIASKLHYPVSSVLRDTTGNGIKMTIPSTTIYSEILSNNTSNTGIAYFPIEQVTDFVFTYQGSYGYYDYSTYTFFHTFSKLQNISKSIATFSNQYGPTNVYNNGHNQWTITHTYNIHNSFRPAFLYVDNNKSTNIFS